MCLMTHYEVHRSCSIQLEELWKDNPHSRWLSTRQDIAKVLTSRQQGLTAQLSNTFVFMCVSVCMNFVTIVHMMVPVCQAHHLIWLTSVNSRRWKCMWTRKYCCMLQNITHCFRVLYVFAGQQSFVPLLLTQFWCSYIDYILMSVAVLEVEYIFLIYSGTFWFSFKISEMCWCIIVYFNFIVSESWSCTLNASWKNLRTWLPYCEVSPFMHRT
jgi:hypothetical protein